ncbi:BRO family protein [Sulfuricurvum sp.]|uniref:BRO-N domain-containing protein n=1 Tax=Sulfuricurvum sp. TaxID=2025608 RepID=UPI0026234652|nr:BRO family protein [Sulfuricurvum sp.]MDD2267452.1 BRO family protein [Sulfuricurvum sp.]MDD2782826.1 BRO family protein [Sulfuricurvum sp.]
MSQIIPFNYGDKQIRVLTDETNGDPLWVAKDVCDVLDLKDVNRSLSKLDDDEKGTQTLSTLGGNQKMAVITESGLYTLVLRSNKPEAKTFKRWVTHEVLPAIRRTGSYSVVSPDMTNMFQSNERMMNDLADRQTKILRDAVDSMAMMIADTREDMRAVSRDVAALRLNVGTRLINAEERRTIYETITRRGIELARVHGIDPSVSTGAIFARIKSRFGLGHYTELPSDRVAEVLRFIENSEISY